MKTHLPYPKLIPTGTTRHGRTEFELLEDFTIVVPIGRGTYKFFFPKGLITDFGSVPIFLWFLINPLDPTLLVAFLVHDDLYGGGGCARMVVGTEDVVTSVANRGMSRFGCDAWLRIFAELYRSLMWKRIVVFYGVRLFGWWPFRRARLLAAAEAQGKEWDEDAV